MSTSVTWNGTSYSIPAAGEVNWPALASFLIALGNGAAVAEEMKQAMRVATTTPVTVSDTADCVVMTKLAVAGAVAVTLPAGTDGRWFVVGDQTGDANTNNITITPNGAETINGSATYVINDNRGAVVLVYSSTNTRWNVVARYTAGSVLVNPMDSAGDMIYGGTAGVATKLDSGSSGTLLVSAGAAAPTWTNTVANATTFSAGVVPGSVSSTLSAFTNTTAVAYDAANFSVNGGGTISPDSGDQVTFDYTIIGNWMSVHFNLQGLTLAGTVTGINILIPASKSCTTEVRTTCQIFNNSGTVNEIGDATISGTTILVRRLNGAGNFTAETNNTSIMGDVSFRIT